MDEKITNPIQNKLASHWYEYLVMLLVYCYFTYLSLIIPLNFDEAYNLQVPVSLVRGHGYNTIYKTRRFDGFTSITTGPTVLLPVAASFKIFGIGKIQARIIPLAYLLLLLTLLYINIKKDFHNALYGLLFVLLFYSTRHVELSFYVLGETPALFFVVLGLRIWRQRYTKFIPLAFMIMGLSALTKFYLIFLLIPLLFIYFLYTNENVFQKLRKSFLLAFCFLIPSLGFEVYKISSLGIDRYLRYLKVFLEFLGEQNSSPDLFSLQAYQNYVDKLYVFVSSLFPNLPFVLGILFIFATSANIFFDCVIKKRSLFLSLLFIIFIVYFFWFVFWDKMGWWRRVYPFGIIFLYLSLHFLYTIFSKLTRNFHKIFVMLFCVSLVFPAIVNQFNHTLSFARTSEAQQEFAEKVSFYIHKGYKIGVNGWWQAPEISFILGGVRFTPFSCGEKPQDPEKFLAIYTQLQEILSTQDALVFKQCLDQVIESSSDNQYLLYSIKSPH